VKISIAFYEPKRSSFFRVINTPNYVAFYVGKYMASFLIKMMWFTSLNI